MILVMPNPAAKCGVGRVRMSCMNMVTVASRQRFERTKPGSRDVGKEAWGERERVVALISVPQALNSVGGQVLWRCDGEGDIALYQ